MIDYEVRDGKRVWPTCPECGCRLGQFEDMWYHFIDPKIEYEPDKDARGHTCSLLNTGRELTQ